MLRTVLSLGLLLGAVAGCATPERLPPEVRYVRPTGAPAADNEVRVRQPTRFVWQQLLDRLQQSSLKVERVDELAGLIVATYHGDPDPYVDCGWIMTYGPQEMSKTPGAINDVAFDWPSDGRKTTLKRSLLLDGRMVVQVRPDDPDTLVSAGSTYVLTKVVAVEDPSGPVRQSSPEVVSFTTGKTGKFAMGTVCQPTGALEHLVFGVLPTDLMTAELSRGSAADLAPAAGPAQSASPPAPLAPLAPLTPVAPLPTASTRSLKAGLDCAGADRGYCQALEIVAPYQQANQQQRLGLAVKTLGGNGSTLNDGDILAFDVSFPTFDSYLHVAYLQRSGEVGHVMPGTDRVWPASAKHYVEETKYEIAPPYGVEMILALATQQPLFPTPRPRFESTADYLAALRQRLAELAAANPGIRIAAAPLLIETKPRQPGVSAAY